MIELTLYTILFLIILIAIRVKYKTYLWKTLLLGTLTGLTLITLLDTYHLRTTFRQNDKLLTLADTTILLRNGKPTPNTEGHPDKTILLTPPAFANIPYIEFNNDNIPTKDAIAILHAPHAKQAYLHITRRNNERATNQLNRDYPTNNALKQALLTALYTELQHHTTLAEQLRARTITIQPNSPALTIIPLLGGDPLGTA